METAGRGAARVLRRLWADRIERGAGRVQVLCGPGGNGGDGYVLARALAETGVDVDVVAALPPARADTRAMSAALDALAPSLPGRIRRIDFESLTQLAALATPDVRVDALVGTGARVPIGGAMGEVVAWLAAQAAEVRPRVPVLALDVPSGLDADTGAAPGAVVLADATATFAAETPGLRLGKGPEAAGRIVVVPVGVPRGVIEAMIDAHGGARASTAAWCAAALPRRAPGANKFTAGHVVVVAGSPAYVGAPVLAASAAACVGAGYVRLATDARVADRLADRMPEIPVTPLSLELDGLDADALLDALAPDIRRADALVIGPGMGRAPGTQAAIRALLLATGDTPTVVDADALAALDDAWLRTHGRASWVLTPHAGELARLVGESHVGEGGIDLADRLAVARTWAARWGVVLVVKGLPSVVAVPSGAVFVGGAHSVALATAGTGDVLAGMTGSFAAQGLPPAAAALLALHTGGAAAQMYARRRATATLRASDLVRIAPRILRRFERLAAAS